MCSDNNKKNIPAVGLLRLASLFIQWLGPTVAGTHGDQVASHYLRRQNTSLQLSGIATCNAAMILFGIVSPLQSWFQVWQPQAASVPGMAHNRWSKGIISSLG